MSLLLPFTIEIKKLMRCARIPKDNMPFDLFESRVKFMRYFLSAFLLLAMAVAQAAPLQDFVAKTAALENKHSGRIGVAVISERGAPLLSYRVDERFAMCSTFKALLAAAVLARVDSNLEALDRPITYTASDILDHAPITEAHLSAGQMTVAELIAAAIQYSDNTAANLLLNAIGGPQVLTTYLRSVGDSTTRLDRNEPSLNTNIAGDVRDTTTPAAMAATLQKILVGDYLSPASKEQLKSWLLGNTTGDSRLRAGFDKFWLVGDKTGSGANGAVNDVAIVFPRGLSPFIIAVFYSGSAATDDEKNAVIAEVARIARAALQNSSHKLNR